MYHISYHPLVLKKDFQKISKADQKRLVRMIHKKLRLQPDIFGKPLAAELKGYYRLRLDPYRILYRVHKKEVIVYILQIGLRKDLTVYLEAAKRLKLLS